MAGAAERQMSKRLAVLLPIRDEISTWAKIHRLADAIYRKYPREVKDGVDLKPRGTFQADAAAFTAALPAEEREERGATLQRLCDSVDELIAEVNGKKADGGAAFSDQDLDLILFSTEVVAMLHSVSKRDVGRFREAINAGDRAYLVLQHLPAQTKTGRRTKIEARFAHELSSEALESLYLKEE